VRPAEKELRIIESAKTEWLAQLLGQVAIARITKSGEKKAERELAQAIAKAMGIADLFGRRRLALEVDKATKGRAFAVPKVPFEEAIEDIIKRHPEVAPGWEATQEAYLKGGFAIARSSSDKITAHVQGTIAKSMREGLSPSEATRRILDKIREGDPEEFTFSRSYAETVYRTNMASAYTRGRIEQAKDPVFRRQIGAWRYVTAGDVDVRDNHQAAHKFVAATEDPVWDDLRPPLGYNCRCALELVGRREALRRGVVTEDGFRAQRVPSGAGPDEGFRTTANPVPNP